LATDPGNLKAHEGLAWAYYRMDDYARAVDEADRRLALAPADAEWRRDWALILWSMPERQHEVLAVVRKWADEAPADRAMRRLLGRVLGDAGDYDEGRRVLNSLLAEAPDDVEALATLATIERWDQRYDEARRLFARAAALSPGDADLQSALAGATKEVAGLRAAHFEPTLPITLVLILVSLLIGQISGALTFRTYLIAFVGTGVLVGLALGWLYLIPID
jgi:tetratricopeptide (TPR) repeat protein